MGLKMRAALAAMAVALMSGAAQAVPYTVTDGAGVAGSLIQSAYTVTTGSGRNKVTTDYAAQSYTYTHNLLDAGYTAGDDITAALLTIVLRDGNDANGAPGNQDPENGTEWPRIEFNISGILAAFADNNNIGQNDSFAFDLFDGAFMNLAAIGQLEASGLLTITLHAIQQSEGQRSGYYFGSSLLTVTADDGTTPPTPAPEPGALALLGLGTLGLGIARRRRHA